MSLLFRSTSLCVLILVGGIVSTKTPRMQHDIPDTLTCFRGNAYLLYQSNWHMMEDIFITQPEQYVSRWFGMRGVIGAFSAVTAVGTYFGICKGINYLNTTPVHGHRAGGIRPLEPPYPFLENKKNILAVSGGLISGAIIWSSLRSLFLEREEIKQLERLLRQWPEVKELCPKELHAPLSKLVGLEKSGDYYNQLSETVRLVKTALHTRFPEKYSANTSTFDHSRINFNLNVDLVKMARIIYHFFIG